MSAQRKNKYIPKAPATETEATEVESQDNTEVESTEIASDDHPEIESPVEMTGAAEVTEEINDQGDPEIVPDSDAQIDPISEVVTQQAAEMSQAEVNGPITTDPEPESSPDEAHDGPLVADAAPMATSPVTQGTDAPVAPTSGRDPRLPQVGSVIIRKYKDRDLQVMVLESGFEFEGQHYKSLSKLAGIISGQVCNGFAFFRLTGTGAAAPKTPKAARQARNTAGDKLAEKVAKIDALILKLKAALDEGAAALAEAEAKRAEMVGTAEQAQPQ